MTKKMSVQSGFSTVELLITLFVGFLFITMGFQLYSVIINRGNNQGDLAIANTYAKNQLETYTNFAVGPATYACPISPAQYTQFTYPLAGGTYDVRVSCPNQAELPNLRLMTIYFRYRTAEAIDARYFIQK